MKASRFVLYCSMAFLAMVSCNKPDKNAFAIDGELVNGRTASKAYLYSFYEEYDKIKMLDSVNVSAGRFHFSGICETPREAFIKFDDGFSFSFILSPDTLHAQVGQNGYCVTGTPENERLSKLVMKQMNTINEKAALQAQYNNLRSDSVLTKTLEDSIIGRYRGVSAEFRKDVEAAMADTANPLLASQARRLFSRYLPKE